MGSQRELAARPRGDGAPEGIGSRHDSTRTLRCRACRAETAGAGDPECPSQGSNDRGGVGDPAGTLGGSVFES
jgi:hypothetical protein